MPSQVIRKVNRIGQQEKQGGEFHFLNLSKEPYEWTDTVQEGDPEFQGLLEEEVPFQEMSSELPGVPLKEDEEDFQVVTKEPAPDFKTLAAAALENAGINTREHLHAAQDAAEGDHSERAPSD